jgi:hypothetical protein
MRGTVARIGAESVFLLSGAGLLPRLENFRCLCAAITANPPPPGTGAAKAMLPNTSTRQLDNTAIPAPFLGPFVRRTLSALGDARRDPPRLIFAG